jgi:coiled-coil domain-containing protein 61
VLVDILTYEDLEILKSKKGRAAMAASNASMASLAALDRRYLILTYEVEFDKVHYPLPLQKAESGPSVDQLTSLIDRL